MATYISSSKPALVPLENVKRKPRTLVLCFDGTTDQYSTKNTNVIKFYSLLRKDKAEEQVCYYQAGIGTYFAPGVVQPIFQWAARMLDEAIAWYLYEHVIDGYKFLMQNYNVGDKVCLFGFSRGAYTARALAGMLHKVGLLSRDNVEQVPFAYKLFKSRSKSDRALTQGFKVTFCREVPIDFVGVWDTVASVGIVKGRTLPYVDTNRTIRVFRQALSLDEHRTKFRPNLYYHQVSSKKSCSAEDQTQSGPGAVPARALTDELFQTDVKEVWFAGCHSDVGGGSALDKDGHSLANIPLRWMVEQAVNADCGILFHWDAFDRWHIPSSIGSHVYKSLRCGEGAAATEDGPNRKINQQDAQDAVRPIHDELKRIPLWWILEFLPLSFTYQNQQGNLATSFFPNFGRGRWVPPSPLFHTSVKIRRDDLKLKYKPRASYKKGTEHYGS
ncbi:hypothetical protein F5148DRAFT_918894 [Russula earlei]|uniref:Uncharacterized protein n=1 Tax=Russula earlei TaxID=71964 RepID=A0ACC0U9Y6_9AGAM|nr:hypothetical protein F5148DRAFT_918894 [Russula earlei]